jgi:hypothetical protein
MLSTFHFWNEILPDGLSTKRAMDLLRFRRRSGVAKDASRTFSLEKAPSLGVRASKPAHRISRSGDNMALTCVNPLMLKKPFGSWYPGIRRNVGQHFSRHSGLNFAYSLRLRVSQLLCAK